MTFLDPPSTKVKQLFRTVLGEIYSRDALWRLSSNQSTVVAVSRRGRLKPWLRQQAHAKKAEGLQPHRGLKGCGGMSTLGAKVGSLW